MAIDFLSKFEEEHYTPRLRTLCASFQEYFFAHYDEIEAAFLQSIEKTCEGVIKGQELALIPDVSYMSISALFTSFYLGMPQFQIDCYSDGWFVLSESVYSSRFEMAWMSPLFDEFRAGLIDDSKKNSTIRIIPVEQINVFVLRALRTMLFYIVNLFKYFSSFRSSAILYRMARSESFFLTFGELCDWQRVIFAILPSVDIFNCDKGTNLRFRNFSAMYYRDKEFTDLDLSHAIFRDCSFTNCSISKCVWNDCVFDNCSFTKSSFKETEFHGASFFRCKIDQVNFDQTQFSQPYTDATKELFREAMFSHCIMKQLKFTDCDLTKCFLSKSDCEAVTVTGGTVVETLFSNYCQEENVIGDDGSGIL